LKKISGVGPFLETKLNNLGIYTFEQVGQFDTELMQIVNDAIEFFPENRDNSSSLLSLFKKIVSK